MLVRLVRFVCRFASAFRARVGSHGRIVAWHNRSPLRSAISLLTLQDRGGLHSQEANQACEGDCFFGAGL